MKPMITISLTKEEAIKLMKILYDNYCYDKGGSFENRLVDDLADLIEVKPWDLWNL